LKTAAVLFLLIITCKGIFKPATKQSSSINYCAKIDSLVKKRYARKQDQKKHKWEIELDITSDRIIAEIEKETHIRASYQFGFTGRQYCDTLFNEDIRRWSRYFNCSTALPKARPTRACDTLTME